MRLTFMTLCAALAIGCGDNGGDATTSGSSSSSGASSGDVPTGGGTSSGDVPTTGAEASSGGSTGGLATGGETGSSGEPGTTGEALDCEAVVDGQVAPQKLFVGYEGSEDLAFDGHGGLALKKDGNVVVVRADMSETVLAMAVPPAYGTRFMSDGRLLVALPQAGKVIAVDPRGQVSDFLTMVQGPNGIFPDLAGDVWVTEFGGDRVLRVGADPQPKVIAMGQDASSANGVVFDPQRSLLFYTNYQSGQIRRVAIDGQGEPAAPELVTEIAGASPDGLTLDACGYLYVVDQGNSTLYRVLLDELGEATAEASVLAVFASNVANAQFGVGEGFDDHTIYLAGNPGDVYAVTVEFPGAAIVSVQ
ncbi:MAG: SMP-30/gluconolactonase/LRE family protein [Nannocystis sp.]|uniref:SMP-30/gluconolactonase/LRE family protein n=1 Tax=Nannocystis sp. TaxID=1962667 RepID=UPI0024219716|nr:SMP-30/gluconolactonase/LRE family protein [Nannocystis sp.]MBK9752934.1 SMP-30/gluconolactonase/LRE family protein [Nannocystis sp.]